MRRLQRDINRLFSGYETAGDVFPAVNVWANRENVVVTAELPGMDASSIDISVQGDQLLLQGEKKADEMAGDVVCHRIERGSGKFMRTFRLPYEVDNAKVDAKYRNGVLTVTLPRQESSKPKKIAINAG
jgi:HSP20 family protein